MKGKPVLGILTCVALVGLVGQARASGPTPVSCTGVKATDQATWNGLAPFNSGTQFNITGMCAGDYKFGTSGLTFANHSGGGAGSGDGFSGMVEFNGAHVTINGLTFDSHTSNLNPASNSNATGATGGSSATEQANIFLHDGAVALIEFSQIGPSNVDGIAAIRSSSISILDSTVSGNGTGSVTNASNLTSGIWVSDGSTVRLGNTNENASNSNGTGDDVWGNGTAVPNTSCQGFDILLTQSSSGDFFGSAIGGTSGTVTGVSGANGIGSNCGTIHAEAGSSVKGRDVTIGHVGQFNSAVTLYGSSAAWFDENLAAASPGGSTIIDVADSTTNCAGGGCSSGAILAGGASSVVLQDTGAAAPVPGNSGQQPAVDISASSTLILAGGNNLCGGGLSGHGGILSGSSCTATANGAQVLQADHSSSILHQQGQRFGYSNAVESISGSGAIMVQSSIDLGQGLVSGTPSISWSTGASGLSVQQNSSFRVSGGVAITGAVTITQGSNAFANTANGGTNAISTANCPFTSVPSSHWAAPAKVTPTVPSASSYGSAVSPQCLAF